MITRYCRFPTETERVTRRDEYFHGARGVTKRQSIRTQLQFLSLARPNSENEGHWRQGRFASRLDHWRGTAIATSVLWLGDDFRVVGDSLNNKK